jgi:hypothetical protein
MYAVIGGLVAVFDGAVYAVIAVNRRARLAFIGNAGFHTIAVYSIIAVLINQAPCYIAGGFAFIADRALSAGVAVTYTGIRNFIAGLGAVTERAIVRAVNPCAGLAAIHRIANLITITELVIGTEGVIGCMYAVIGGLVAAFDGAVHAVFAVNRRAELAISCDTCFLAIAVQSVITVTVL